MSDDRSKEVSLGCGTLILIALIVLIFSNRGVEDLEKEIKALKTEVGEMKKSVEGQTNEIRLLQQKFEKPAGEAADNKS